MEMGQRLVGDFGRIYCMSITPEYLSMFNPLLTRDVFIDTLIELCHICGERNTSEAFVDHWVESCKILYLESALFLIKLHLSLLDCMHSMLILVSLHVLGKVQY